LECAPISERATERQLCLVLKRPTMNETEGGFDTGGPAVAALLSPLTYFRAQQTSLECPKDSLNQSQSGQDPICRGLNTRRLSKPTVSEPFAGIFIVTVTPLDDRRNQDEDSYRGLIEYYSRARVKGLTILGESAERDLLSEDERQRILTMTLESVGGRLPIVVGTGSESLQSTVQSSVSAQGLGASAVMIPPPRGLKTGPGVPNEDAIFDYFSSVGDAIEIPIVIQDFPQTDRPKMSPALIGRLNREISNAKYLKLEDPPTPLKLTRIREVAGDLKKAFDIYLNTLPLVYYCSELGLAVRKEVLVKRGVIRTSRMKLPERELADSQKKELADVLGWVEKAVLSSSGVAPLYFLRVP